MCWFNISTIPSQYFPCPCRLWVMGIMVLIYFWKLNKIFIFGILKESSFIVIIGLFHFPQVSWEHFFPINSTYGSLHVTWQLLWLLRDKTSMLDWLSSVKSMLPIGTQVSVHVVLLVAYLLIQENGDNLHSVLDATVEIAKVDSSQVRLIFDKRPISNIQMTSQNQSELLTFIVFGFLRITFLLYVLSSFSFKSFFFQLCYSVSDSSHCCRSLNAIRSLSKNPPLSKPLPAWSLPDPSLFKTASSWTPLTCLCAQVILAALHSSSFNRLPDLYFSPEFASVTITEECCLRSQTMAHSPSAKPQLTRPSQCRCRPFS